MKRVFAALLIFVMMFMLVACGGAADISTQPAGDIDALDETMADLPDENGFIPDFLPGEENTCSTEPTAILQRQGNYFYYGAEMDGSISTSNRTVRFLKMPVDGTVDDIEVVITSEDMAAEFGLCCPECGYEFSAGNDYCKQFAVVGDWIYFEDDAFYPHILRARTDGGAVECVLCSKPDDLTAHKYLQIRDNMLYYIARKSVRLDASTTSDKYVMEKKDLKTGEILSVGDVPEDFSIEYEDNGRMNRFKNIESFISDGKIVVYNEDCKLVLNKDEAISSEAGGYDGSKGKYEYENLTSLPGMDGIDLYEFKVCKVNDGFCFSTYEGLYYYSYSDEQYYKINNDDGWRLCWPGDGYLYYELEYCLYRVKLDGTGWEDMLWMTTR